MAFDTGTGACPCGDYDGDFATPESCGDTQEPGNAEKMLVICKDKVDLVEKVPCGDSSVDNAGMIHSFILKTGQKAAILYGKCKSIGDESESTYDKENCSSDINELVTFKGITNNQTKCFNDSYLGKPVYVITCGEDGRLKAFDTCLTRWKHESGLKKGDFIGMSGDYTNTTSQSFCYIDPTVNFGDVAGFFTAMTTV